MLWIDAEGVITLVAYDHSFRDRSVHQFPGVTVSVDVLFLTIYDNGEFTSPTCYLTTPDPAWTDAPRISRSWSVFVDIEPETLDVGLTSNRFLAMWANYGVGHTLYYIARSSR